MQNQEQNRENVLQALQLLSACQAGIEAILAHSDYAMMRARIVQHLAKAKSGLQMVTGVHTTNPNDATIQNHIMEFKPMTTVGGEKLINRAEPLTPDRLNVKDDVKQQFIQKRDILYNRFLTMSDDEVFTILKQPDGENLIRSMAKKAGMMNFRNAEINTEFLEEMRLSVRFSNDLAGDMAKIQEQGKTGEDHDLDDDDEDPEGDALNQALKIPGLPASTPGAADAGKAVTTIPSAPPPPPPPPPPVDPKAKPLGEGETKSTDTTPAPAAAGKGANTSTKKS